VAKLLDEVWCRGVFVVGLVDPGWMDGLALNLTQEEQVSKTARVHVDYIHIIRCADVWFQVSVHVCG